MGKLSGPKKHVKRVVRIGAVAAETVSQMADVDARIEAIQLLIPLGLEAVAEELQRAVMELAGRRYERHEPDQPLRRWTNSAQRHRWVATALLYIEPRLRRIKGCRHLPMLRQALQAELGIKQLAKAI